MEDKIIEIIKNVTECDEISKDCDLIDDGILDSLAFIELIAALENEYNVELQPTQIPGNTWRKVESITNMIKDRMEK